MIHRVKNFSRSLSLLVLQVLNRERDILSPLAELTRQRKAKETISSRELGRAMKQWKQNENEFMKTLRSLSTLKRKETKQRTCLTTVYITVVFARGSLGIVADRSYFSPFFFFFSKFSASSSHPLSLIICTSSMIYLPSLYFWLDSKACS